MDRHRIDDIALGLATGLPRRAVLRRVLGLGTGGLVLLRRPISAAANHKDRHCAKVGQRCTRHKDCCGTCGPDGVCLSCAGVVGWTSLAAGTLDALRTQTGLATDAADTITAYFEETNEIDVEALATVRSAAGAIDRLAADLAGAATPEAASDLSRALLDALADVADALSAYQDRIADEAFIGTAGDELRATLAPVLVAIPTLEAGIAALRDDCAP